jgi:hypothetical protein
VSVASAPFVKYAEPGCPAEGTVVTAAPLVKYCDAALDVLRAEA